MAKILQKKTVAITTLPSSCSQRAILMGYVLNEYATVNVVLTLDGGQYVGYIGYPDKNDLRPELRNSGDAKYNCERIRSFDQVAKLGDRLDDYTRDAIFPRDGG